MIIYTLTSLAYLKFVQYSKALIDLKAIKNLFLNVMYMMMVMVGSVCISEKTFNLKYVMISKSVLIPHVMESVFKTSIIIILGILYRPNAAPRLELTFIYS